MLTYQLAGGSYGFFACLFIELEAQKIELHILQADAPMLDFLKIVSGEGRDKRPGRSVIRAGFRSGEAFFENNGLKELCF